ncbi:MAG: sodium:proton antiporter [Verrucomicrobia bacterium]|nr:sodium:proton antiporter [Verrucomicrobiota bacterium]
MLISIAAILALGIGAQWIAWRLRLPSILLLLLAGFAAGPVLGWLHPDKLLGDLLMPLVSISVGLILFEGGLTLKFSELKAIGSVVRNLVTVGALVTWAITILAAKLCFGWTWGLCTLLGAVLVVTGPTVIMPLLRHIQPVRPVASTLKWEGILIDPVGAMLALLVFEVLLSQSGHSVWEIALMGFGRMIGIGMLLGVGTGLLLAFFFQRYWVPDYLQNPVALMAVVGAFALSNHWQDESGLLTTTVIGITLANQKWVHIRHIVEFKENLRVLLISGLFILLSARLNLDTVRHLSPLAGFAFLMVLMLIARPASVFLSALGSTLKFKERAFLSWMAPRGIVAASVASIFAVRLAENGYPNALEIVPVTFMVIVGTVAIYGLTAGHVAVKMELSKPNPQGVLFVGCSPLVRKMALSLQSEGFPVLLADTNRENVAAARLEGLPVYFGNILSDDSRDGLELMGVGKLLGMTSNHEVNTLAGLHLMDIFGRSNIYQVQVHAETDRKSKAEGHGRLVFAKNILLRDLNGLLESGAVMRRTRLSAEFGFEQWKEKHGAGTIPLFLITETGTLRLFTLSNPPLPVPGQTILALGQPEAAKPAPAT